MKKLVLIIFISVGLSMLSCGDDLGQQTGGQGTKTDTDNDGTPDASDTDDDNDGIKDESDNCPLKANQNQADGDGDSVGDVCDTAPSDNTIPNPTPPADEGITPTREHLVSPSCDNDSCFNLTTKQDFLTCSVIRCESVLITAYLDEGYYSIYDKPNNEKTGFIFPHYADDNKETRKFITGIDVIEDGSLADMNDAEIYALVRENFTSYDEFIAVLKDIDNVNVKVEITTIEEDGTETKETKVIDETTNKERHRVITASKNAQDAFPGADESDLYWTLDTYMEGQLEDYVVTHELPN